MPRKSATPALLRDLRSLRVTVFHPNDEDGIDIIRQLQRIGCQIQAFWPPTERLPEETDLVFLAVRPETLSLALPWTSDERKPPVIAVLDYENPTTIESMLKFSVNGVVASPVKSFGLLSAIVVARQIAAREAEQLKQIQRLDQRLAGIRRLTKAKTILMETRGINEEKAYEIIREQAMSKRVTTEEIANAIIHANEILGFRSKAEVVPDLQLVQRRNKPTN
jgi:AmiR/NasT family two-component response regulator